MSLSENLKQLRQQRGFTLEETAESVNVTRQAICKYEQGKMIPNGLVLVDLAIFLGTTAEKLVYGKEQ